MPVQEEYLQRNVEALMKCYPVLAEKLQAYTIDASWSLIDTPYNAFAAWRDEGDGHHLFSNSVIDPLREADEWVSMHERGYRTLIILGFGLGYHVRRLLTKDDRLDSVLIIEAGMDLFGISLLCSDWTDFMENPNCRWWVAHPPASMATSLKPHCRPPVYVRKYLPAIRIYPDYYRAIEGIVEQVVYEANVGDPESRETIEGIQRFMNQLK